ncbi:MAG: hypothetical protein AABW50_00965 [Nanoarchaeota archaeon]
MKRGILTALFLLSLISINFISSANIDEFQRSIEEAAHYAEQYHANNINYAQFSTYLSATESKINSILSKKVDPIAQEKITELLGESGKKISWVKDEVGGEKSTENELSVWENALFDGKIHLKYNLFPVIDSNKEIYYKIDFSLEFKEAKPLLDMEKSIESIETLVRSYNLIENPEEKIITANHLAESIVTLKNLFNDYSAQSTESCEETMVKILGTNSLVNQQEIVGKEITLIDQDETQVIATTTTCEGKCEGINQQDWISLNLIMKRNGQIVSYPINSPTSEDDFKDTSSNGFKQNFVETNRIIKELAGAKNYPAVYSLMERLRVMNKVWDKKANEEGLSKDEKLKNYVERIQFLKNLWTGLETKSSTSSQKTFEKTLIQEVSEESREICTNEIDDNSNQKIDCKDSLCSGQSCGSRTIEVEEDGQNIQKIINFYCVLDQCVPEKETKTEVRNTCGNKICEENETESCSSDCQTCSLYPEIECSGEVISKGEDQNGCVLEPICIEKTTKCTEDSDCSQPLCGKSQCVLGECKTTSLNQCGEQKCINGEQMKQKCASGETIVFETCSKGIWRPTGTNCAQGANEAEASENHEKSISCKVSEDCSPGYSCSSNQCRWIPIKKVGAAPSTQTDIIGFSVTGQAVVVTGEISDVTGSAGITTIIGEEIPESEVAKYQIIQKEDKTSTASRGLTGIVSPDEEFAITQIQKEPEEILQQGVQEKVIARGICIETSKETKSLLYITGGGEKFSAISQLEERYDKDGAENYCAWNLKNELAERKEFVRGMKNFAEWFSQDYFSNSANNWEGESRTIKGLSKKNTDNLAKIAQSMKCLNMKELETYQLVSTQYKDENLFFNYQEELKEINGVKIPSPKMELIIFPNRDFVKQELQKAMVEGRFPGSIDISSERTRGDGLTAKEKDAIEKDEKLIEKISNLASQYPDNNVNIQLIILDKTEAAYNMYIKIDANGLIKAQVMPLDKTPPVDIRIEISYSELYSLIKKSAEASYKEYAPWEASKIKIGDTIETTINWFSLQFAKNSFEGSMKITPSKSEKEIQELTENILKKISQEDELQSLSSESLEVWSTKGQKITVA